MSVINLRRVSADFHSNGSICNSDEGSKLVWTVEEVEEAPNGGVSLVHALGFVDIIFIPENR